MHVSPSPVQTRSPTIGVIVKYFIHMMQNQFAKNKSIQLIWFFVLKRSLHLLFICSVFEAITVFMNNSWHHEYDKDS